MTALLRKVALKKVEFIAFLVQTTNLSCRGFVVFLCFCFCLFSFFLINTHYMWFIEGQDLATEAVSHHFLSDGKVDSQTYEVVYPRN